MSLLLVFFAVVLAFGPVQVAHGWYLTSFWRVRDPACVYLEDRTWRQEWAEPIDRMGIDYDALADLRVVRGWNSCGRDAQRTRVYVRIYYERRRAFGWALTMSDAGWCVDLSTLQVRNGVCNKEDPARRPWYGSIAINSAALPANMAVQMRQKLVTHEMGHVIGLGHPVVWPWEHMCEDVRSVMIQGFLCQQLIYHLTDEDKNHLDDLYPPLP